MQLRGRFKQLAGSKVNRIHDLVFNYKKLKKKVGKNAILDKLKMHIRHIPSEEEQVFRAAEVVFDINVGVEVPYLEILRKVICLTGLTEAKVDAMLPEALEKLDLDVEEMSNEEIKTAVAVKKDDVLDAYCDVLLKRRFNKRMIEK